MTEIKKKVDSEWKKRAEEEKEKLEEVKERVEEQLEAEEGPLPPPTFLSFLAGLDLEARLALGEIKHPQTGQAKKDLIAAQYVIDTLALLQEKTKGNLTSDEERTLQNLLTELRFRFVQARGKA
ncbi:MAG TPA: DUF1844 domain-containing protein [Planctomycetota bacterium]|nr:DUF1844 domain-containing protein [Planctomycetota bacterium]